MSVENGPEWRERIMWRQYDEEKVTRIMPDQIRAGEIYTVRLAYYVPPTFVAYDLQFQVNSIDEHPNFYYVPMTWLEDDGDNYLNKMSLTACFNMDGFLFRPVEWPEDILELTPEEEAGYMVGSTDPIDIGLGKLLQEHPLVTH